MFTSKGLFSQVACPYQDTCVLPRCIFGHSDSKLSASAAASQEEQSTVDDQQGQRKRQKVTDETEETEGETGLGGADTSKVTAKPSSLKSTPEAKAPKRRSAATKEISPPPLRRKSANGTPVPIKNLPAQNGQGSNATSTPTIFKAAVQTPAKAPVKVESLNPRALKKPAPASHDMRHRLLKALHEQLTRLNSELEKDASNNEEEFVLSEQAVITMCLGIEEEAAGSPTIYSNLVKNKILAYKRMTVKQWVEERGKEVTKAKALEAASISDTPTTKSAEPPKPIETGLNIHEELTLLHRLYTPIAGLSKHGYVTKIPTEKEGLRWPRDGRSVIGARLVFKSFLDGGRKMVPWPLAENAHIISASHTFKTAHLMNQRQSVSKSIDAVENQWAIRQDALKQRTMSSRYQRPRD
jgi:RNA exonuclease 1